MGEEWEVPFTSLIWCFLYIWEIRVFERSTRYIREKSGCETAEDTGNLPQQLRVRWAGVLAWVVPIAFFFFFEKRTSKRACGTVSSQIVGITVQKILSFWLDPKMNYIIFGCLSPVLNVFKGSVLNTSSKCIALNHKFPFSEHSIY